AVAQHDHLQRAVDDGDSFHRAMTQRGAADVQMLCGDRECVAYAREVVVASRAARLAREAALATDGAIEDRERRRVASHLNPSCDTVDVAVGDAPSSVTPMKAMHISSVVCSPHDTAFGGEFGLRG